MSYICILLFSMQVSESAVIWKRVTFSSMESVIDSNYSHMKETRKALTALLSKPFQISFKKAIKMEMNWESLLPFQLLYDTLEEDRKLYKDDKLFVHRRKSAKIYSESKQWSKLVTEAFWEIVRGQEQEATAEFRKMNLYNSLCDFIHHINYFETVRKIMEERGERVYTFGYNYSSIHDIDKLHPVMLVAFAEKFDDHKDTSLWNISVQNHININSHHQGNSLWSEESNCSEKLRNIALGEMICDKVSRRLQKDLKGQIDEDMWNIDSIYFEGLPSTWIIKATQMLTKLKQSK